MKRHDVFVDLERRPFVRSPYNYDADQASHRSGISFEGVDSLTDASEALDADINTLVKRFGVGGPFPQVTNPPTYGDFSGASTYQEALHVLMAADEAFMTLPWDLRRKFDNDPAKFVAFCEDPANLDEMREMGLATPQEKSSAEFQHGVGPDDRAADSPPGGEFGFEPPAARASEGGLPRAPEPRSAPPPGGSPPARPAAPQAPLRR